MKHSIACDLTAIGNGPSRQELRALPQSQALGSVVATPSPNYHINESCTTIGRPLEIDNSQLLDLELLHHWSTSTYATLSHNPMQRDLYRINYPKLGFKHPFVLRAMLALSALHLAHFRPSQRGFYTQQAITYHSAASSQATRLLPNVTRETATPLFGFSMLTCFYLLASPKRDGDLLLLLPEQEERQDGTTVVEWLLFFRGIRSLLAENTEILLAGELGPLFSVGAAKMRVWLEATQENPRLRDLESLFFQLRPGMKDEEEAAAYEKAICYLKQSFNEAENAEGNRGRDVSDVFRWAFLVPERYLRALFERQPLALVIFGWYCVLLKHLDGFWWMQGWTRHHISRVWGLLGEEYRSWIRWPVEEIGWVPPN